MKCNGCGRFRKDEDIIGQANEYEEWLECVYCTSDSELEFHGKQRKLTTDKQ